MKKFLFLLVAFGSAVTFAAPVAKTDPVAEGFPAWQGVVAKNYILGREICPSDLRHKTTVVIELEANDSLHAQLLKAGELVALDPNTATSFGENWETRVLPRHTIVLLVIRGGGKTVLESLQAAMKMPKEADEAEVRLMANVKSVCVPIYADITFEGAPDAGGKYPFVYVMGPTGTEPLFKGPLDVAGIKGARAAAAKAKKAMGDAAWEPFFGTLPEEKRSPALLKTLLKGKTSKTCPLAPVAKAILKDVVAKDAEKAAEAQIGYDALEQTRSDLVMRIKMEAPACPHRAWYDAQQLLKYWPGEKKRLDVALAKVKANPEAFKLAQMFSKVMVWADPEFTCKNAGEAKKIVQELTKMKKDLEKLKESKVVIVQNGAQLMDSQIDDLTSLIPTKVPEK